MSTRLYQLACAVRDALTFEEQVVIWVLRNHACHYWVDRDGITKVGGRGNLRLGARVKEEQTVAGKTLSIPEIDRMVREFREKHTTQRNAARALAQRIVDPLKALMEVQEILTGKRPVQDKVE